MDSHMTFWLGKTTSLGISHFKKSPSLMSQEEAALEESGTPAMGFVTLANSGPSLGCRSCLCKMMGALPCWEGGTWERLPCIMAAANP